MEIERDSERPRGDSPAPRPGAWRALGHVLASPFLVLFVPWRAARFVPTRGVVRSGGVAALAGVLLVPTLVLAMALVVHDVAQPPSLAVPSSPGEDTTALPAPQANLVAAVSEGLVADPAPPPVWHIVGALALWLATGVGAGLTAALLLGLALQPFLGRDWLATVGGALRAGAHVAAAVPLAVLTIALVAGLVARAQHPAAVAPLWLFLGSGLGFLWTTCATAVVARGALTAAGVPTRRRAALGALLAGTLVWPVAWLVLQLASLPLVVAVFTRG